MRTAARADTPPDVAGRTLRGAALHSLAVHALLLALPGAWWLLPAHGRHEVAAPVEVVFGDNAELPGAVASALPATATAAVRTDVSPSESATPPPPAGSQPTHANVEATAAPGNRAPRYPDGAWLAREQGEVVIRLHIEPDGRVSRVEVRRSSGHAALDQAAAATLARWRFLPALRDGVAVASYRDQATDFELEGVR